MGPHTNLENKIKVDMLSDLYTVVDVLNKDRDEVNKKAAELWNMLETKSQGMNLENERKSVARFNLDNLLHLSKGDVWTLVDFEFEVFYFNFLSNVFFILFHFKEEKKRKVQTHLSNFRIRR